MLARLLEVGATVARDAFVALRALDDEERPTLDPWAEIAAELDSCNWPAAADHVD
jgi:hypothetical protein